MNRSEIESQLVALRQEFSAVHREHRRAIAILAQLQRNRESLEVRIANLADGIDDLTNMLADLDADDSADWWKTGENEKADA